MLQPHLFGISATSRLNPIQFKRSVLLHVPKCNIKLSSSWKQLDVPPQQTFDMDMSNGWGICKIWRVRSYASALS
jgi:hypothetical protein